MTGTGDKMRCMIGCCVMGALAGVLAVVLLVLLGGMSWPGSIFTGGLLGVVVTVVMLLVLCPTLPTPAEAKSKLDALQGRSAVATGVAAAPVAAAAPAPAPVAEKKPEPTPAPEPVAEPVSEPVTAPVSEAVPKAPPESVEEGAGTKPTLLTEARAGGPDNLKEIKGVGPKMEGMLHGMGIFHFDQVASWSADEVSWVDDNLQGFKGRVSRDDWVAQAKLLAAGGETEFSKKVGDGGVY